MENNIRKRNFIDYKKKTNKNFELLVTDFSMAYWSYISILTIILV